MTKATPHKERIIEIVGGPNGSGKSTFAESYFLRTKGNAVFLNPDIIAAGIGPLDFERASFQAGRLLITEVKDRVRRGERFSFESTLSGKSWLPLLRQAIAEGYSISIYFLYLSEVQKNLQRIQMRVKQGGHLVPKDAVMRRYPRCFQNFWHLYRPLTSDWYILDNTTESPSLVMAKTAFDLLSASEQNDFATSFLDGRDA